MKGTVLMIKIAMLALLLTLSQTSCIMAGGYSSTGGWFIWPGGLLGLVIIIIVILFLRRRK